MSLEQELAAAAAHAEAEFKSLETKIENLVDPAVAKVAAQAAPLIAQVEAQVQAVAPIVAAAVTTDVGGFVGKLRDVLDIFEALPAEFDTFAAPLIKAGGSDIEGAIAKLDKILAYKGIKPQFWTDFVGVVKAL